jgi:hypothetical protein
MGYDPENYSQAQLDELDSLTERWVADHLRMTKASKKQKRTRPEFPVGEQYSRPLDPARRLRPRPCHRTQPGHIPHR